MIILSSLSMIKFTVIYLWIIRLIIFILTSDLIPSNVSYIDFGRPACLCPTRKKALSGRSLQSHCHRAAC